MSNVRMGWIGCGRMGSAMARRLIVAGHDVTVTNRTRSKAEALGTLGASVVDTPRQLAECDVVFITVSANEDLLEVTTGEQGVLSDLDHAPRIVVDCSTVSSDISADVRLACDSRNVQFLAAPVSGNPKVVASGKLTFAVSGPEEAFDFVRPYLEEIGAGATYVGEGEVARLVKICHNIMLGVVTQTLAEITVLAEKGGVSRHAFLEFLNESVMGSMFTRYKSPTFVNLDFTPTFTPVLLRKDLALGLAEAKKSDVPMPLTALCNEMVTSAITAGYVNEDFGVLLLETARRAGLQLESEEVQVDDGLGVG